MVSEIQRVPGEILWRMRSKVIASTHKLESALGRVFLAYHALERKFVQSVYERSRIIRQLVHNCAVHARMAQEGTQRIIQFSSQRIAVASAALGPLNPEAPLERGYSIAYKADGKVVKNAKDVMVGEQIMVRLYTGKVVSRVEEKFN